MGINNLLIDRKVRKSLGIGRRIYSIAIGIIVLIIGMVNIVRDGFFIQSTYSILHALYILLGVLSIIRGSIGKEFYKHRYCLRMDYESLRIKITFEDEIIVNLNSITNVKTFPMRFEIAYEDYVKTYDFSWLSLDEFEKLSANINDYSVMNKIMLE